MINGKFLLFIYLYLFCIIFFNEVVISKPTKKPALNNETGFYSILGYIKN